jgi:hypothetical protein
MEWVARRAELDAFTGVSVTPAAVIPSPPLDAGQAADGDSPDVRFLRQQAETQQARSLAIQTEDRWQLQLIGAGGPYFSHAFEDGNLQEEYYLGVGGVWRPDFRGARRQRALAEERRARASSAAAESRQRERDREIQQTLRLWEQSAAQTAERKREAEAAEQHQLALHRRWRQGVDSWRAVQGANRRVTELRLEQLDRDRELTHTLIDYAEWVDALDALPQWLGQTETP